MRRRLLVRHFLNQFVENDFSPDVDRHQLLAVAAAALVTVPLFSTVFMSVKYLVRPLQAPGWTQMTTMGDQVFFCATSLIVSAAIATLEWDALALSPRDSMILGVLPLPREEVVRAKVTALVTFAGVFVIALNALPTLLHPPLTVANFTANPLLLVPLVAAQGLSTSMAGAFGFASVVGLREVLFMCLGEHTFSRVAGTIQSGLLFSLLVLLVLAPVRLAGRATWMLEGGTGPLILQPVGWFAATHAAIAGRVIDKLPAPALPDRFLVEENELRTRYRSSLPHLTRLALRGAGALAFVLTISMVVYLRNARRFHLLPEGQAAATRLGVSRISDRIASALTRQPATRAGLLFLARTVAGNPPHRGYILAFMATGMALLITTAPDAVLAHHSAAAPIRTSQIVAQTLMLTAMVAGFRAALRTSADTRAAWIFGIAETGDHGKFRNGVRLGVMTSAAATVLLLFPLHAAAWGVSIAAAHAINGAALGWLLVEIACAAVEQPLVRTIPPSDGLNTVGVVLLGITVLIVLVLARIELAALSATGGTFAFAAVMVLLATIVRRMNT
ncbi:MAG: hypothetical protein ACJ731_00680 [Vicinamibacterales bacterium]